MARTTKKQAPAKPLKRKALKSAAPGQTAKPKAKRKAKKAAVKKTTSRKAKARQTAPKKKKNGTPASKLGKAKTTKAAKRKPARKAAKVQSRGRRTGTRRTLALVAKKKNGKRPTRRNSDDNAAGLFEEFHGTPATRSKEHRREIEYRSELAELGTLKRLDIITPAGEAYQLDFTGPVKVTAEPRGAQIYFLGGNQSVPVEDMDLGDQDATKDHIILGVCTFIVYRTSKAFHDFEQTDYGHEFGEDGGDAPFLNYDNLNRLMYLTGGSYQVKPQGIID